MVNFRCSFSPSFYISFGHVCPLDIALTEYGYIIFATSAEKFLKELDHNVMPSVVIYIQFTVSWMSKTFVFYISSNITQTQTAHSAENVAYIYVLYVFD